MTAGSRPLSPFPGLLLLLLAFTGVHLYRIEADPPVRVGIVALDSGTFVDEGYKGYDARNEVLFDSVRWSSEDEYGGSWTGGSPINTFLTRVTFEEFGIGIAPVRILSLIFGIGTLLLFWILLRRRFGEGPALIGTTILLLHPLVQLFSRLALLEIKLLFFCVLAMVLVPKWGGERGRVALGWGGVLLALVAAFLTKETALVFIGSFAAGVAGWVLFARFPNPRTLRLLTTGVVGGAILFVVALAVGCAEPDACSFLSGRSIDPPLTTLRDFALADFIFLNPAILLLALLGSANLLRGLLTGAEGNSQDLILLSWFLLPTLFFNALAYQPERYFLLPLPAMVWLALYALVHLREIVAWLLAPGRSPWPTLVLTVTLFLAALHFTPPLLAGVPIGGERGILPRSLLALPFGALLGLIALGAALALRFLPGAPMRWARSALRPAILALAFLGTALGAGPLLVWAIDPPYQLLAESARIEAELGPDVVLVGDWAPQLGMLTEARTIYSNWNVGTGEYRNVENLGEIGATHLVFAEGINERHRERLDELFPGARNPDPVLELDYAGRRVLVYEFRPLPE